MGNITWPIALYDLISIIAPGFVMPGLLGFIYYRALRFYEWNVWVVLAASFILGHIVQALSKITYAVLDETLCKRLWPTKEFLESAPPELGDLVKAGVTSFYGVEFTKDTLRYHLKDLCYSPVWNRMDNYKLFTALADLYRALGFLSLVGCFEFLGLAAGLWPGAVSRTAALLLFVVTLALVLLFTDRTRFFRRLSELVVYHSFLSFMAERRL